MFNSSPVVKCFRKEATNIDNKEAFIYNLATTVDRSGVKLHISLHVAFFDS